MMPSPNRRHRAAASPIGWAVAACCAIALWHGQAFAQAPAAAPAPGAPAAPAAAAAAPAGGVAADVFYRLGFFTVDQLAFKTHPFYQITGNSAFADGHAVTGTFFNLGAPKSDSNSSVLIQAIHSLPSFYVEGIKPVDTFLPKAVSLGLDYYVFTQRDVQAARSGTVAPIKMDLWLYQFSARAYAFDPNQPGINFYGGVGFGILDGKLTAQPFAIQSPSVNSFNQFPTGAFLFGIESKGDNFGLRYELTILSAKQVSLSSNPFGGPKTIDFSGSLTRLAIFYQF
jgi:hypothetical protein